MRKWIAVLGLTAAWLAAAPELRAQGKAIELSSFDIVGLKLGQSLPEAIETLKKHNPKFTITIRRVGLQKWDSEPGCTKEATHPDPAWPLPTICGNWSDGMGYGERDREDQKKLPPNGSLIAGLVAYDDQRAFGPPRKIPNYHLLHRDLLKAGEETISLVVTPEPGNEKIVLISRAKSYSESSAGFDDLKSQIYERYKTPASRVEGLHETSPMRITLLNLYLGSQPLTERRNDDAFVQCGSISFDEYDPGTENFLMLRPAWPNRVVTPCGHVIRAHVRSYHDNNRYAHGFSVIWFDQDALFKLSRKRVLVAKRLRDVNFNGSTLPKIEKF